MDQTFVRALEQVLQGFSKVTLHAYPMSSTPGGEDAVEKHFSSTAASLA